MADMYKIMLSSTYVELKEHRQAVREAMLSQRMFPIAMEDDAALPDQDLIDASLAKVDESDGYVGLVSYRYGQTPVCPQRNPNSLSLTELEFHRALERKIPICMFIMHDDHQLPKSELEKAQIDIEKYKVFLELVKKDRIYAEFKSVDDLKAKTIQSLVKLREVLDRRAQRGLTNGKPVLLSNIPIRVPMHFMGREEALAAIAEALKRHAVTVVRGLRGVGKTTLAAAFAEKHRGTFRATWWIRAQTEPTMRADLVALGVRLNWTGADAKDEEALAAVLEHLRGEGEGLLLIYDNAPDAASLKPYLPPGGESKALVTSNAHAWRGIAQIIELPLWPKETGADYLIARTGQGAGRAAAEALSAALGGLPLAHEQAAAYCDRLGISPGEYKERFEKAPVRLLDAGKDAPGEYHGGLTVAKTFALAIGEAAQLHPAAEPLIVHAALLAPEPIPLFLFSEAREKFGEPFASALAGDGLDEAVAALRSFALVDKETIADERDPAITTQCIRLHRLVRAVAAARAEGEAREHMLRTLIAAMAAVYPKDVFNDPKSWPRARWLDALAFALVGGDAIPAAGSEGTYAYLLNQLGLYRQAVLAAYAQARPLYERALAICQQAAGAGHPDTAASFNNLAGLLYAQGDYEAARPLYERALAIREKALGAEHPHTAVSLNNLALLLYAQGEYEAARPLFERALATREKAFGAGHPETANSLNNLAGLLYAQGAYEAARPLYERALAIREKVLGEHPNTAQSLNNLAALLQARGNYDAAQPLYERAVAIDEKLLGPEHPDTAIDLGNLAHLLQLSGDYEAARPLYERALAIREKVLGPDYPATKTCAASAAKVLDALGRVEEAAALRARFGLPQEPKPPA